MNALEILSSLPLKTGGHPTLQTYLEWATKTGLADRAPLAPLSAAISVPPPAKTKRPKKAGSKWN